MNLFEFNRGSHEEQSEWVWQEGILLTERIENGRKVELYHMGEFYAEVYYLCKDKKVSFVRGFKKEEFLIPYQENLKLRFKDE